LKSSHVTIVQVLVGASVDAHVHCDARPVGGGAIIVDDADGGAPQDPETTDASQPLTDVSQPPMCIPSGTALAPPPSGVGYMAEAQCGSRTSPPDPSRAPRVRGITVRSSCACPAAFSTDFEFDLQVDDPDTPAGALRTCFIVMTCQQGIANGTSFALQCAGGGLQPGSWALTVVDPEGNWDFVGYTVNGGSPIEGCANQHLDCDGPSPSDGSARPCF